MLQTVFLVSLVMFVAACGEEKTVAMKNEDRLPYYNSPDFTPLFVSGQEELQRLVPHSIGDFSFTDQNGNLVTQKNIEGKIHVADFFFTSCGSICPRMTHSMKQVHEAFPNDTGLVLLSYSVTPWIDSVAKLNDYARANSIDARSWHLLTGSKSKIYDLARRSYFAEEELGYTKDSTEFLHTEHFLLVDGNRKIRGIYNGTLETEIQQLIEDIRTLEKETD
jgi:protein SCO1/2